MEKIRIGDSEQMYEIAGIMPVLPNVLQIAFVGDVPTVWGDITIYTSGGMEAATLTGYETVYREEENVIYLSNDGSVYVPPEEPGEILPPEPYEPTLAELQAAKKQEVSAACERAVYAGINVTLTDGSMEHYRLTIEDQLNLFGKMSQINSGAEQLEYHADGQPCRYYSAADMLAVIQAAMWHVSYHTTYCNALNMWINGCQETDDVPEIFYGADVPEEYRSEVLNAYLIEIAKMAEENGNEASAAE